MSLLFTPTKSYYFLSIIYRRDLYNLDLIKKILAPFQIDFSIEYSFPRTQSSEQLLSYYQKEMGHELTRVLFFHPLALSREHFVDFKLLATKLEAEFSASGKRRLNIDVGILSLENMQLASGKMYSHRVYLRDGVYSDLHYQFIHQSYVPLVWTYPDYAQSSVIEFFNHMRGMLQLSL